jgi:hypothetical protein
MEKAFNYGIVVANNPGKKIPSEHFDDLLQSLTPGDGWIDVKDRLPECEGSYLAWVTKHTYLGPPQGFFIVYYGFANDEDAKEMFWLYRMEEIELSHWQPLPSPPPTT